MACVMTLCMFLCMYVCMLFRSRTEIKLPFHQHFFSIYTKTGTIFIRVPWGVTSIRSVTFIVVCFCSRTRWILPPVSAGFLV